MITGNPKGVLLNILKNHLKISTLFKKILKRKALQAQSRIGNFFNPFFKGFLRHDGRASFGLSVRLSASVSVEASVAIPIFMFCFLEILSLLNYLSVYNGMLFNLKVVGEPISVYGCVAGLLDEEQELTIGEEIITSLVFSEGYLDARVRELCSSDLYRESIKGGSEGISMLGSTIHPVEDYVSVVAHYTIKPYISLVGDGLLMSNRYYGRLWTGYAMEETGSEEYVYIADKGSVYHLSRDCMHLRLSIKSAEYEELGDLRSASDHRYYACEVCCDYEVCPGTYYYTKHGERYHSKLSCPSLKRTVHSVKKSDATEYPLCKTCLKQEGE